MKPDGSGGFKVAGEHPDEFKLEMDNGGAIKTNQSTYYNNNYYFLFIRY